MSNIRHKFGVYIYKTRFVEKEELTQQLHTLCACRISTQVRP